MHDIVMCFQLSKTPLTVMKSHLNCFVPSISKKSTSWRNLIIMIVSDFLCYTVLSFLVSCSCMGTLPLGTPQDFYELPLI